MTGFLCPRCGQQAARTCPAPEGRVCARCYLKVWREAARTRRREASLSELVALVAGVEPALPAEAIRAAIAEAAPRERGRAALLDHLRLQPELLTSGSSAAPRVVCRLAAALTAHGATRVAQPSCARCGKGAELVGAGAEGRFCRRCAAWSKAVPCSACGRRRPVNGRTQEGEPLCAGCDRRPPERCQGCGQLAEIQSRRGGTPICRRCYRQPRRPCGRCGRIRRVSVRARGDQPDLCPACHWAAVAVCVRCGAEGPTRGVRKGEPVCLRCLAAERLDDVLAGQDAEIPPPLLPLRQAFLAAEQPRSVHVWLDRSPGVRILRQLASGALPLSHEALDELPQTSSLRHLRALLVAAGALPERDPHLASLERARDQLADSLEHPDDRRLLLAFATWRILHRLRRRARRGAPTVHAAKNARTRIAEAARFLAWLRQRGLSLADLSQADVDRWLAGGAAARRYVRDFLGWARERGEIGEVEVASGDARGAPRPVDAEARWVLARRLLHDEGLDPADRVAGALVVLYAQPVSRIASLRLRDVIEQDGQVFVSFGRERVLVPEPLASLLGRLPWRRQVGPSGKVPGASEWLFPGRQAGRHLHPEYLRSRLGALGIDCRASRNAALLQLAAQVPAAVLADTLNLHPNTAVRWVKTASGDWSRYAAERARAATAGSEARSP
ncbi:MAG: hypothetical protein ACRD2Z_01205 [Thermoanaerobaculia bacterium]